MVNCEQKIRKTQITISRRGLIGNFLHTLFAALATTLFVSACGKRDSPIMACDDLTNVVESDIDVRKKLGYAENSPIADHQCHNCNLYLPPKEGHKCGGCMLFKGPVFATAYCTYWAPKTDAV